MKRALVLGVNGQCGSYLAEILLEKGYEVHGMVRRPPDGNLQNIKPILDNPAFFLCHGDIGDTSSLTRVLDLVQPCEIYNLADQGHPGASYDLPEYSARITGFSVAHILETLKRTNPKVHYFQPCTSHMFGIPASDIQTEETPFDPQSPYACAKTYAYYLCRYYRKTHNIFASTAIMYNSESPRRPLNYVSRKISR